MIEIKEFSLKNVVHFKDATLKINNGLNIVRGLNKSSRNKNQSNAAGKSLLFFPLANIIVGSPPINSKKKNKVDLLKSDSCCSLKFSTHSKHNISVRQYADMYDISENGKSLEITTSSKAEKQIREYFPLSAVEFYSTCYLTTQPHPFITSSPTERLTYISNLFRLHDYDVLKKHFSIKLRAIKDSETEYRTLLTEFTKSEQQIKRIDWDDGKQEILASYENDLLELNAKLKTTQENLIHCTKMAMLFGQYSKLKTTLTKLKKINNPKERYKKLSLILSDCEKYAEYEQQLKQYHKTTKHIKDQLSEVHCDYTVEQAETRLTKARKEYDNIQELIEEADERKELFDTSTKQKKLLALQLSEFDFDIPDVSKREELNQKKYAAQSLMNLSDLLEEQDDNCELLECPTCKSSLETKKLKHIIKKAKLECAQYTLQLKAMQTKSAHDAIVVPKYDKHKHSKLRDEADEFSNTLRKCVKNYDKAKRQHNLQQTLNSILKPTCDIKEPEYDIDDIKAKLDQCREYLRIQKELYDLTFNNEIDLNFDANVEADAQKQYNRLGKKVNALHEIISELKSAQTEYNLLSRNQADIRTKLDTLQIELDNKKITESLVAAYGPKGLKINAITNICQNLESNFNSMSSLIFGENFNFEIGVTSSGIDVIAHRPKGYYSDIKMLSGAESDNFRLLFLPSLLTMMPEDRKTNLVILDEPASHMSPVSKEKFINDFLPHLCSVVPSVYIIEPQPDFYPNANNLLVTKENGICTLTQDLRQY